jgi:ParB-like chromosome segregation protein Spo0J
MSVDGSSDPGSPGGGEEGAGGDVPPAVHRHFTAPALIPLDRVDDDRAFLVRSPAELEDVASLATDLARLGQLFPIDVRVQAPDRFQLVSGFRRVAALRFLQRDTVLARLHADLSDEDAQLMALASAIHGRAVDAGALLAVKERLEAAGRLSDTARTMLDKALETESQLGPEEVDGPEETEAPETAADPGGVVEPDELAWDIATRLSAISEELEELTKPEFWSDVSPEARASLMQQLAYAASMATWLEQEEA